MKKLLRNNIIFILFLSGIFTSIILFNYTFDALDYKNIFKFNIYSHNKADWIYSKIKMTADNKYDKLQIGSSSSRFWVNYDRWEVATIMLIGVSYEQFYEILNVFMNFHPEIKTVFVPLEYPTLLTEENPVRELPNFDNKKRLSLKECVSYYLSAEITVMSFEKFANWFKEKIDNLEHKPQVEDDYYKNVEVAVTRKVSCCELAHEDKFQRDYVAIGKIIDYLQDKNVKIICYIPPLNYVHLEGILLPENLDRIEKVKKLIVSKGVSIYDYSFANKNNTAKMFDSIMFYDVVHPDLIYGNMAFEQMLENKKSNMYKLITKNNLQETNAEFRKGLQDYRNTHKDYIEEYKNYDDKMQSEDWKRLVNQSIPENLWYYSR